VVYIAQHRFTAVSILPLVLNLALAGLLLPGGILLFMRKPAGRMMTIIGSGVALAFFLLSFTLGAIGVGALSLGVGVAGRSVTLILAFAPAIATLVLAIVKPTAVWVGAAAPQPPMMMPGAGQYPPQQQYWGGPQG